MHGTDWSCRVILLVLGIIGKFPASVEDLKAQGTYNVYVIKYG